MFPTYISHLATGGTGTTFKSVWFAGYLSGLDLFGDAFVSAEDCYFWGNRADVADLGSGVRMYGDSSGRFVRCLFKENNAGFDPMWQILGSGGAVQHRSSGTAEFIKCLFTLNDGLFGGAIYAVGGGDLICRDCVFRGNYGYPTTGSGTSIYSTLQGGTTLINCLFDEYPGGGIPTTPSGGREQPNVQLHGSSPSWLFSAHASHRLASRGADSK